MDETLAPAGLLLPIKIVGAIGCLAGVGGEIN